MRLSVRNKRTHTPIPLLGKILRQSAAVALMQGGNSKKKE
jgi:hypothetical protein